MDIHQQADGSTIVMSVSGRLDSNTSQVLEEALSKEEVRQGPALVLDLAGVQYVSSAGLRVLLKAAKSARATKTRLALSGLSPQVREVFDISGFTALFQIFGSAAEARAAVAG